MTEGNKKMAGNETSKDETRIEDGGELLGAKLPDKTKPILPLERILKKPPTKQPPLSDLDEYNSTVYQYIKEKNDLHNPKLAKNFEENKELIESFASAFIQTKKIARDASGYYQSYLKVVDELNPDIFSQIVNTQKKNMSKYTLYELEQIQKHTTDNGNIQIKNNPILHQIVKDIEVYANPTHISKNPYLLLLPLTHQEREFLLPLFNEARKQNLSPFPADPTLSIGGRGNYTQFDFPEEPTIFSLKSLLLIGKKLEINNLAEYMEKLQRLTGMYKNTEREEDNIIKIDYQKRIPLMKLPSLNYGYPPSLKKLPSLNYGYPPSLKKLPSLNYGYPPTFLATELGNNQRYNLEQTKERISQAAFLTTTKPIPKVL